MIDLRQLRYFVAVAEERNFGRAAARLHVSQPPITRQIKMLEAELGVLLFERTHFGVNLTPAGEELLARASQVDDLLAYATDRARRAGMGAIGRLDVGAFGSGVISIVPAILRRYMIASPDVEVTLLNVPQPAQLVALRQRRILVTFDRYLPPDADLCVEIVAQEPLVLALHETNPLARLSAIPVEALAKQPMIMARDAGHRKWVGDLCRAHGFEPSASQSAGDMIAGIIMASNGFGVQIAGASAQAMSLPGLVFRPLQSKVHAYDSMELQCAHLKNETSPLLPTLMKILDGFRKENALPRCRNPGVRAKTRSRKRR
jgi:DNA-binding transcriptional LysR family regulator